MSFPRVSYEQDILAVLADYRNLQDGRPTWEGSDTYTQAAVKAALAQDLRAKLSWIHDQGFADSAAPEFLERHAALRTNIYRRPASGSSGSVNLTGNPGQVCETGMEMVDEANREYVTTSAGVVDDAGLATVTAEAVTTGLATRLVTGQILTLVSAPAGLSSQAQVAADWAGGSDVESDAELLARHLWLLRHPPAGGNQYDYVTWAMGVAGVWQAYHFPRLLGLGTNVTVITANTPDRLPGPALLADVLAEIEARRPAGLKDVRVWAPTLATKAVTAQVALASGVALSTVTARIQTALAELFGGLVPGDSLTKARIETAISLVEGVVDRVVTLPAANVVAEVSATKVELLTLGAVTVTEMA